MSKPLPSVKDNPEYARGWLDALEWCQTWQRENGFTFKLSQLHRVLMKMRDVQLGLRPGRDGRAELRKLDDDDAWDIWCRLQEGEKLREVAEDYGISPSVAHKIKVGSTYRDVTAGEETD